MKNFLPAATVVAALNFISCSKNLGTTDPSTRNAFVSTIAGTGEPGYMDGPALQAQFFNVFDVAVHPDGYLLITDLTDRRVRRLSAAGIATTFAGDGTAGNVNGPALSARFREPSILINKGSSEFFILDGSIPQVRRITTNGTVGAYAGTETFGYLDGPVATAKFNQSWGLVIDRNGDLIVADTYNHRIRKINSTGEVSTLAGSGIPGFADGNSTGAQFDKPYGICIDPSGNIYVADANNFRIRKIAPSGSVTTHAGSGIKGFMDGDAKNAAFSRISDMAGDKLGNVYVIDANRIRKISPDGTVTTIAGSESIGFADGLGAEALFSNPRGLSIDAEGNIYIADSGNRRIRKITFK